MLKHKLQAGEKNIFDLNVEYEIENPGFLNINAVITPKQAQFMIPEKSLIRITLMLVHENIDLETKYPNW